MDPGIRATTWRYGTGMTGQPVDEAVRIRPADIADLAVVYQIEKASYSVPWSRNTFRDLLERTDTDTIVAEVDGRVVGYAISWFVLDQGELGNVAVAEAHRRQGIGRRLVGAAIERARARGVRELYLEVRRSNTGAQRLYLHMGFRQVGVRRNYYVQPREDALVMRHELAEVESA